MKTTDELISQLANELEPVKPVKGTAARYLIWLGLSGAFALLAIHWYGPVRQGALQQLLTHPRFMLEMLFGSATIAVLALSGFRSAIPAAPTPRLAFAGLFMLALWLASYLVGIVSPALEPSMLGKREHCVFETFFYGLPPAVLGIVACLRLYTLNSVAMALRVGLAAGLIPALYMQIACMYGPIHALTLHMLPGILVGLGCAGLVWLLGHRQHG